MDLPTYIPGADAHRRVSVECCKPPTNPHDRGDMPKYLPDGLTQYLLNNFTEKFPPYYVTQDDVSTALERVEVEKINGMAINRSAGGVVIAVLYETHWTGLSRPSWERATDLQLSLQQVLLYWAGTPNQHRETNRLYRQIRIGAAQRELSRANGECFMAFGYGCVPRADWLRHYSTALFPHGAHVWYKADDGLLWLRKISARTSIDGKYLVRFLTGQASALFGSFHDFDRRCPRFLAPSTPSG